MAKSNASEVRRVRHEMSAEAAHDVRKLIAMLSPLRERVRERLVDHGGMAEQSHATERVVGPVSNGKPLAPAR